MTTIHTKGIDVIVVEVPDDAFEFKTQYEDKYTSLYIKQKSKPDNNPYSSDEIFEEWYFECVLLETSRNSEIPNLKIISLLRYITESQCERLVDFDNDKYYKDYLVSRSCYQLLTAKESLISLLQANGIDTTKNLIIIQKQ